MRLQKKCQRGHEMEARWVRLLWANGRVRQWWCPDCANGRPELAAGLSYPMPPLIAQGSGATEGGQA